MNIRPDATRLLLSASGHAIALRERFSEFVETAPNATKNNAAISIVAAENGLSFTASFEHVTVSFDCQITVATNGPPKGLLVGRLEAPVTQDWPPVLGTIFFDRSGATDLGCAPGVMGEAVLEWQAVPIIETFLVLALELASPVTPIAGLTQHNATK